MGTNYKVDARFVGPSVWLLAGNTTGNGSSGPINGN